MHVVDQARGANAVAEVVEGRVVVLEDEVLDAAAAAQQAVQDRRC